MKNNVHNVHTCNSMNKKIEKKTEAEVEKKYTAEDVKQLILSYGKMDIDPEVRMMEFSKKYSKLMRSEKLEGKELEGANKDAVGISMALSIDTGHALAESVPAEYRSMALQIKRDLHQEFDCKTVSEKVLVDLAVGAYIRQVYLTKKLILNQNFETFYHEINGYLAFVSKEIDRAHRQFIGAIESLKSMKQPTMRVSVKTNNAFIGENQQFNNNQTQRDENNEVK